MANDLTTKITIQVDSKEAGTNVSQLAAEFKKLTDEFKKPLGQIDAFVNLKKSLGESKQALEEARSKVTELARQMKEAGTPSKELSAAFEQAKKKAGELKEKVSEQQIALQNMRNAMSAAGVDVTKLASEQVRLKSALQQATEEFKKNRAVASAKDDLGLKSTQQIRTEIDRLKASYKTLADSGTMSMKELGEAKLRLNQRIQELKTSNNGLIETFDMAKGAILGLVGAAVGIKTAVGASKDLETAMSDVAKVVDAPASKIEELRQRFLALSREMPLTAIELARIAEAGGQMGIAAKDIEDFVKTVAKMAVAFKMTAEDAGTAIGKLINLYHLTLSDVNKLADAINLLGNNTNAVERDIVNVITRAGGMAQIFGLSAEQAAALGTAFLSLGRTPETAAMAINALLSKLQTAPAQSKEFQEALDKIGISSKQLADEIEKNPQAALLKFLETLKQLGKQDLSQALVKLFGLEYQDDLAILVSGLDKYKEALGFVADSTKTAGAVSQEYERGLQTLDSKLKLARNSFTELWNALGDTLLPVAKLIVQGVTEVVQVITDLVKAAPGLATLTLGAGTLAASIGALRVVALAANFVFGNLVSTLGAMAGAFGLAFTGMTAFQTAVAGLGGLLISAFAGDRIVELTKVFMQFLDLQKDIRKMSDSYKQAADEFKDFKDVKIKGLDELKLMEDAQLQAEFEGLQKAMSYWNRFRAALETRAGERSWGGLFQTDEAKAAEAELPKVNARIDELREALGNAQKAAQANGVALKDFRERAREAAETASKAGAVFEKDLRMSFDTAKKAIEDLAKEHQRSSKVMAESYDLSAEKAKIQARDEATASKQVLDIHRQKKDAIIQAAEETARRQKEILDNSKASETEYADASRKITEQLKNDKIKAIEDWMTKLKSAYLDALNEEQKHLKASKDLQAGILISRENYQTRIKELERGGMSETLRYYDKLKEAEETYSKARVATYSSRSPEELAKAVELVQKAMKQAESTVGQVKEGDQVVISYKKSLEEAMKILEPSQRMLEELMRQQAEAEKQAAEESKKRAEDLGKQLDDAKSKMEEINKTPIEPTATIKVDSKEIDDKLREIQQDTYSTHHIRVVTEGGGGSGGESEDGYRWGGLIAKLRDGGNWLRMIGKLPGWGGGDRIRALLEAGEFVIRKEAVAKYGAGFFNLLNSMKINLPQVLEAISTPPAIPRLTYATGGPVVAELPGAAAGGANETITWRWQLNDKEYPLTVSGPKGTGKLLRDLEKEIGKLGLVRSRV